MAMLICILRVYLVLQLLKGEISFLVDYSLPGQFVDAQLVAASDPHPSLNVLKQFIEPLASIFHLVVKVEIGRLGVRPSVLDLLRGRLVLEQRKRLQFD